MACKSETREINGHTYFVTQMAASKAIKTKLELMSYLGNSLTLLADLVSNRSGDMNEAISYLTASISKPGFYELMERLVREAGRDGEAIRTIDEAFSGHIEDFWLVALFVLEVNYKDFLSQIGSKLKPKLQKVSPLKQH